MSQIRTPKRLLMLLVLLLALVAAACASDDTAGDDGAADAADDDTAEATEDADDDGADDEAPAEELGELIVGSTNFDEQELVAEMYALSLEDAGFDVERRYQLGSREVVLPALTSGDIDLYPEYVGTALEFLNDGAGEATSDTDASLELLRGYFGDEGVDVLEPSAAEDKNGLVVTAETAEEFGLATTSDLADVDDQLALGGPPECPERPLCLVGYTDTYGLEFADFRSLDAGGPVTVEALDAGEIDVAVLFTTDAVIAANGWVLLEDDMGLQPAENITPVIRSDANGDAATAALNAVSELLTTDNVSELLRQIRVDGDSPAEAAEAFLTDQGLLSS